MIKPWRFCAVVFCQQVQLSLAEDEFPALVPDVEISRAKCAAGTELRRGAIQFGFCYAHGPDVAEDWVEAYKWLSLAARQGDEGAKNYMTVLESKLMTPEQIAQGQKRAREFKPL
jgi:hypothetical protein